MVEVVKTAVRETATRLTGRKFAGSVIATLALCFIVLTPTFSPAITVGLAESAFKALVAINLFFFGGQTFVDGLSKYLGGKEGK